MISLFSSIRKLPPLEILEPMENLSWKIEPDNQNVEKENIDNSESGTKSGTKSKSRTIPVNTIRYLNEFNMLDDDKVFDQ